MKELQALNAAESSAIVSAAGAEKELEGVKARVLRLQNATKPETSVPASAALEGSPVDTKRNGSVAKVMYVVLKTVKEVSKIIKRSVRSIERWVKIWNELSRLAELLQSLVHHESKKLLEQLELIIIDMPSSVHYRLLDLVYLKHLAVHQTQMNFL